MTQPEAVRRTMEKLGGIATLGQLYQEVFKIEAVHWGTKTPTASIRRIVQLDKEIYKIKPGLYGLNSFKERNDANGAVQHNVANPDSAAVNTFNHYYYQGLLLTLGNFRQLGTYCPQQDKNRLFVNQPLKTLRSLQQIPPFTYQHIVKRSESVDVIWFGQEQLPHSFFEVEHSTDIQNSLLKFCDLKDFYADFVIVADEHRRTEFEQKVNYSSFNILKDKQGKSRVRFVNYELLDKQYLRTVEELNFPSVV